MRSVGFRGSRASRASRVRRVSRVSRVSGVSRVEGVGFGFGVALEIRKPSAPKRYKTLIWFSPRGPVHIRV